MLTAKELANGIITNIASDKQIQQVGIDLTLAKVRKMTNGSSNGMIFQDRTVLPSYSTKTEWREATTVPPTDPDKICWYLEPGLYEIVFNEGCKIPANVALKIRQRSSLLRCGASLHSSIFDPGFETERIGTVLTVNLSILIEVNARVAQIYGSYTSSAVDENYLYGSESRGSQFQNDKQR